VKKLSEQIRSRWPGSKCPVDVDEKDISEWAELAEELEKLQEQSLPDKGKKALEVAGELAAEPVQEWTPEQVREDQVKQMRNRSGRVKSTSPVVALLYELCRDHLPVGILSEKINALEAAGTAEYHFTNGWLANFVRDCADRLQWME